MKQLSFKKATRRLVFELAAVVLLVGFGEGIPEHHTTAQAWSFILSHVDLLLHVLVGTVIIIESIILTVRAWRAKNRAWNTYAITGLAFVLLAYGAGETFVITREGSALGYMTVGWLGALVIYAIAWAKNREKRVKAKSSSSTSNS